MNAALIVASLSDILRSRNPNKIAIEATLTNYIWEVRRGRERVRLEVERMFVRTFDFPSVGQALLSKMKAAFHSIRKNFGSSAYKKGIVLEL